MIEHPLILELLAEARIRDITAERERITSSKASKTQVVLASAFCTAVLFAVSIALIVLA